MQNNYYLFNMYLCFRVYRYMYTRSVSIFYTSFSEKRKIVYLCKCTPVCTIVHLLLLCLKHPRITRCNVGNVNVYLNNGQNVRKTIFSNYPIQEHSTNCWSILIKYEQCEKYLYCSKKNK